MNIFISGTDTDVGKTLIAAGLAAAMQSLGYQSGVFKPLQTGVESNTGFLVSPDIAYVKGIDPYIEGACTYTFRTPAAPLIAAEVENTIIDPKMIIRDYKDLQSKCDTIVVEGAGGLLAPVAPRCTMLDIMTMLNLPVVFVMIPRLGSINHILLTLNQAKMSGINVSGVIVNRYPHYLNNPAIKSVPRMIEEYTDYKVLGVVKEFKNAARIVPSELIDTMINSVDIEKIFNITIPKLSIEY